MIMNFHHKLQSVACKNIAVNQSCTYCHCHFLIFCDSCALQTQTNPGVPALVCEESTLKVRWGYHQSGGSRISLLQMVQLGLAGLVQGLTGTGGIAGSEHRMIQAQHCMILVQVSVYMCFCTLVQVSVYKATCTYRHMYTFNLVKKPMQGGIVYASCAMCTVIFCEYVSVHKSLCICLCANISVCICVCGELSPVYMCLGMHLHLS